MPLQQNFRAARPHQPDGGLRSVVGRVHELRALDQTAESQRFHDFVNSPEIAGQHWYGDAQAQCFRRRGQRHFIVRRDYDDAPWTETFGAFPKFFESVDHHLKRHRTCRPSAYSTIVLKICKPARSSPPGSRQNPRKVTSQSSSAACCAERLRLSEALCPA